MSDRTIVHLDASAKALVPCKCGSVNAWLGSPVGKQPGYKLTCCACNKFHNWLSPKHAEAEELSFDVIDDGDLFEGRMK